MSELRTLYPEIEPFDTGRLRVSPVHELYYKQCGNPEGKPVVFLHGGPGAGLVPDYRRFFDAFLTLGLSASSFLTSVAQESSIPHASLEDNTTWHLVADIEQLREHLGIERWLVFGGSWGSTLALAYSETHPERVTGLVLRGIFLGRQNETLWFYQGFYEDGGDAKGARGARGARGASAIFPDGWEDFVRLVPEDERHDMIRAYYRLLTNEKASVRAEAAHAWSIWESSALKLIPDQKLIDEFSEPETAIALARIECHYFMNNCFFETDNYLLEHVDKIRNITGVIVQGRYDIICPMTNAWDLHRAWPEARLEIILDAGHASLEPGFIDALVRATDSFRETRL